jgi:hypothetical protein
VRTFGKLRGILYKALARVQAAAGVLYQLQPEGEEMAAGLRRLQQQHMEDSAAGLHFLQHQHQQLQQQQQQGEEAADGGSGSGCDEEECLFRKADRLVIESMADVTRAFDVLQCSVQRNLGALPVMQQGFTAQPAADEQVLPGQRSHLPSIGGLRCRLGRLGRLLKRQQLPTPAAAPVGQAAEALDKARQAIGFAEQLHHNATPHEALQAASRSAQKRRKQHLVQVSLYIGCQTAQAMRGAC